MQLHVVVISFAAAFGFLVFGIVTTADCRTVFGKLQGDKSQTRLDVQPEFCPLPMADRATLPR